MKIILEKDELLKLYEITKNTNSPIAAKIFNTVFSKNHHRLIDLKAGENHTTEVGIDVKISMPILDIMSKHSYSISQTLSGSKNPLLILSKIKTIITQIGNDILNVIS